MTAAISALSGRVGDLVDRLKKQSTTVNNVYVTADPESLRSVVREEIANMAPREMIFNQEIHTPKELNSSEIYRVARELLADKERIFLLDGNRLEFVKTAIEELTEALRLTVEYTGNDTLPAIEGWSWFDALKKYAPEKAQYFVDHPIHFPKNDSQEDIPQSNPPDKTP